MRVGLPTFWRKYFLAYHLSDFLETLFLFRLDQAESELGVTKWET